MDVAGSTVERVVTVPGQGRTVVWDCPGPPGAPTLLLVHGATMTAELNWSAVFPVLGRRFRVLAFDQRGHGRGLDCTGATDWSSAPMTSPGWRPRWASSGSSWSDTRWAG
ncbi:MAG: alpha/beta fold hydrolase [Pseudonocardiaceae bacterium]